MIDDVELRTLFSTESEEHLLLLETGLLRLESDPTDGQTVEEVFRAAHSLKGGAAMLGLHDLERLAHGLEDVLNASRRSKVVLTPEAIDQLCEQLDLMRQLVHEAIADGADGSIDVTASHGYPAVSTTTPAATAVAPIMAEDTLQVAGELPESEVVQSPQIPPAADSLRPAQRPQRSPAPHAHEPASAATPEAAISRYRLDTMRVEPQKLDTLMNHARELTVARSRIARRLAQIGELVTLCEEWSRESFVAQRSMLAEQDGTATQAATRRVAAFLQRERERLERLGTLVNDLYGLAYEDTARLDSVVATLEEGIRNIRLLPLATIFQLFPRMVRDLARDQGKDVQLRIEGGDTTADKRLLEEMKDPLMHMVRNAIDHGLETPEERQRAGKPSPATLHLRAYLTPTNLVMEVTDDGRGLDLERIKQTAVKQRLRSEEELTAMTPEQTQALIFVPGFSTSPLVTNVSGRGVGLDVVRAHVERLKGSIQVESSCGHGCTLRLYLPRTLEATRVLIVMASRRPYAVPVDYVHTTRLVAPQEMFTIEAMDTIVVDGKPISIVHLSTLLELVSPAEEAKKPMPADPEQLRPCIILSVGEDWIGLFVDALLDEQEVVVKPHAAILQRVRNVSGATVLGTGEICIVLNPLDLIQAVRKRPTRTRRQAEGAKSVPKQTILLVEDSMTTRTQEKRILESAGYEVVTAVNGVDALQKLSSRAFAAVVSDVEMPHMDGLSLTEHIRREPKYRELPILLVTSLATEEDKRRGAEVGANAYIAKPTFDQKLLLDTLRRLI